MTSCPICDVIIRFDDDFPSNGNLAEEQIRKNKKKNLRLISVYFIFK